MAVSGGGGWPHSEPDDEQLAERVHRGDVAAFEALYDRHRRGLLSLSLRMLRSLHDAEDAVQQTFLSAYEHLARGERPRNVAAWLYAIARNNCLMTLRRRKRDAGPPVEASRGELVEEEVEERSELDGLFADISALPDRQRAALVLFELGDLSQAEIGQALGCETASIKGLVFQARSALVADRRAREMPCNEIRAQLVRDRGWALRRRTVRHHMRRCQGCMSFYASIRRQRPAISWAPALAPLFAIKRKLVAAAVASRGLATGHSMATLPHTVTTTFGAAIAVAGIAVGAGAVASSGDTSGGSAQSVADVRAADHQPGGVAKSGAGDRERLSSVRRSLIGPRGFASPGWDEAPRAAGRGVPPGARNPTPERRGRGKHSGRLHQSRGRGTATDRRRQRAARAEVVRRGRKSKPRRAPPGRAPGHRPENPAGEVRPNPVDEHGAGRGQPSPPREEGGRLLPPPLRPPGIAPLPDMSL